MNAKIKEKTKEIIFNNEKYRNINNISLLYEIYSPIFELFRNIFVNQNKKKYIILMIIFRGRMKSVLT